MNTSFTELNKREIFSADVSGYFGSPKGVLYLLYSPFNESAMIVSSDFLEKLEKYAGSFEKNGTHNIEIKETYEALTAFQFPSALNDTVKSPAGYSRLTLIPNYKCNFNCSYCYSAKGRSDKEIAPGVIRKGIDYFINRERIHSSDLTIFISGGGEPLLSWGLLRNELFYAKHRAINQGFRLSILLMTNGSVLNKSIIKDLKELNVNVGVSFEILEEIQEIQRGHYHRVARNIKKLTGAGVIPSVSATITKANVDLQEKMVEELITAFPEITGINFDPVTDASAFGTPDELRGFLNSYLDSFFKARAKAFGFRRKLYCNMLRRFETISERYCNGKLCLTPEGTFSICHSITSPQEKDYEACIYGHITESRTPEFDQGKFNRLINDNVYAKAVCASCIAKWHCAGGCLMHRIHLNPVFFEEVCNFSRDFITRILLEQLDEEYMEEYNISLKEAVTANE